MNNQPAIPLTTVQAIGRYMQKEWLNRARAAYASFLERGKGFLLVRVPAGLCAVGSVELPDLPASCEIVYQLPDQAGDKFKKRELETYDPDRCVVFYFQFTDAGFGYLQELEGQTYMTPRALYDSVMNSSRN